MKKTDIEVQRQDTDSLPTLVGKMADDLTTLLDAKLSLLKIELREELAAYVRGAAMIAVGSVIALVGFALLNVAVAFLVSTLFQSTGLSQPARYALGFAITAFVYLAIGAVLIILNKNKLAEQDIVPRRTVAELKRDKNRIGAEL